MPHPQKRGLDFLLGFLPTIGVLCGSLWMGWVFSDAKSGFSDSWKGPLAALSIIQASYFLLQAILWMRYRPFVPDETQPVPMLSVIIPAYNEGAMVARSIRSVLVADYPQDKLEVLVVDDGSRDDTYFYVEQLRREFPRRVRIVRFTGNKGKRAALNSGFRAACGEIVITLDSDSEIDRQTLREMVAPFQADPKIGAVAGRVAVIDRGTIIERMLQVQYTLAFDFARAAQSAYRTVACCPGALSAFRRAVILPELPAWLDQRFLGHPVSHGEDQALTNAVLKSGYDTVYQSNAIVRTLAPQRYRQLCKMFTRWDRSFVVEGFSFARFMFTRYRTSNRILPVVEFFFSNTRLILLYVALANFLPMTIAHPQALVHYFAAMVMAATCTALYYLRIERSFRFAYGVLYAFYSFFLLTWILPWAIVTVRDQRWGTR